MSNKFLDVLNSDEFREEFFVAEAQARLQALLEDRGVTRAELSRKLGVSRARITQIFSDDATNLTLRLLARSYLALGEEPVVISRRELEKLQDCEQELRTKKGRSQRSDRCEPVLTASLIAEALRSSQTKGSSDGEKSLSPRSNTAKKWADHSPNVVPLRSVANG